MRSVVKLAALVSTFAHTENHPDFVRRLPHCQ